MSDYGSKNKADNTDRRIRKTRAALKKSLTSLLQEKSVKDISVKELTELADVNRGTFYLHYKDVFDLLEHCEADLMEELQQTVDSVSCEVLKSNPVTFFERVYSLCLDNADFVRVLLGENGDIKFLNSISFFLEQKCFHELNEVIKQDDIKNFEAYFSFLVGGCVSLLQYWFSNGMKQTPRDLAEITVEFLNPKKIL